MEIQLATDEQKKEPAISRRLWGIG